MATQRGALLLALLLVAAFGCQDQRVVGPHAAPSNESSVARVLQAGDFEDPCGTPLRLRLVDSAGEPVGEVTTWNGETTAYAGLVAPAGWEFVEVRVGGARRPQGFPRTGGAVDPGRFPFGGQVAPAAPEVVIEALHLGNPFGVHVGDGVLIAVFARLRALDGGQIVEAWAEGTAFQPGAHPAYFPYVLQECEAPPPPPPPPPPPLDPSTIATGSHHSCGLTATGRAYCWGENGSGQLGDGTQTRRLVPTAVETELRFADIALGERHTCAITEGRAAYCWGWNNQGALGDGTTSPRLTPTAVAGELSFTGIAAGALHTCAVALGGAAYCWGLNGQGQLGDGTTAQRQVPTAVLGSHVFRGISAGSQHSCAITFDDVAYCWGANSQGQLGDGTTTPRTTPTPVAGELRFVTLSVSVSGHGDGRHTCGVSTTGAAYCWGINFQGQLGDGSFTERHVPTLVSGELPFVAISAGSQHTCGITPDEQAYCWGSGFAGELGNGAQLGQPTPTAVAGGLRFAIIAVGGNHTCALTPGGEAYCWGRNVFGQVGDGTSTNRLIPTPVSGWGSLVSVPW